MPCTRACHCDPQNAELGDARLRDLELELEQFAIDAAPPQIGIRGLGIEKALRNRKSKTRALAVVDIRRDAILLPSYGDREVKSSAARDVRCRSDSSSVTCYD
jgi:hypothetical protein